MENSIQIIKDIFSVIIEKMAGMTGEQIALASIFASFLLYLLGKHNELQMKKHEAKKEQYIKLLNLLEKIFKKSKNSRSNNKKLLEAVESDFFDLGSSLMLYGSRKLYKQYIFYREFSTNPIVEQSKYYSDRLNIYILAGMFRTMRKEVGLNSLHNISDADALGFFINNIASNPKLKVELHKARYQLFMIKLEIFVFDCIYLVGIKKFYYTFVAPFIGILIFLLKYCIVIPITKLVLTINPNAEHDLLRFQRKIEEINERIQSSE